ncbi:RHOMBOID-like protein 12, mitochondrial isoform X2 [Aristolochia californica]|uniref:RHOMBOID-like protein 12, mitochondrial isoform X2 n=1 Tax=Aristolochia californica TaxID=171875 RepID=UPI0035DE90B7
MQRFLSFTLKSVSKSSYDFPASFHICNTSRNLNCLGKKGTNKLLTSPLSQSNSTFCICPHSFHTLGRQIYKSLTNLKLIEVVCNPINLKKLTTSTRLAVLSRRGFSRWRYHGGSSWRSFLPNADEVVWGLIGINVAVLLMWRSGDWLFMLRHFTVSMENFKSGRIHTLLTSAFSHKDFGHLLQNCFGLYFFGTHMGTIFGPLFLLKLYVAGGVVGSIFFLVHDASQRSSWKDTFRLKAYALGAILIGTDVWRTMQPNSEISGAAHLGGAVVAVLVWARIKKRWI